ncbi:MAG: hypothetical protein A2309_10290, partial [Bacteroidetes bacterium RIFOXYB2_FULL_35_7]
MGHGKETPRQKMIGMMYLFLTALLAMNVSKDILDSFILVEHGVGKTVENFAKKNDLYYSMFMKAATENPAKAAVWNKKALEVQAKANETVKFMHDIRKRIVEVAGGAEKTPGTIKVDDIVLKDNTDHVPRIMIIEGKGEELRKKIDEYRKFLIGIVDKPEKYKDLIANFEKTLDTKDPEAKEGEMATWVNERFEHLPLIASVVFMTILEGDIRNAEADMLAHLYNNIDAADLKFNKIEAIVNQNSMYVMAGSKFTMSVFMAAYDSTQKPTIYMGAKYDETKGEMVGNPDTMKVENGKGVYEVVAQGTGKRELEGAVKIKTPDGFKFFPWKTEYNVMQGGVVVSPTKMNVFYRGIPNPVKISAVGVPDEKVSASITNGSIRKVQGGWEVLPGAGLECVINVTTNMEGNTKAAGTEKFRVKNIPTPVATINGQSEGRIQKNQLTTAPGIAATLKDFPFDLRFNVVSYTFLQQAGGLTKEVPI